MFSMTPFADAIEDSFDRGRIETFWACRPAFESLLSKGIPQRALNEELARIAADPGYTGDWRPDHLLLHRGAGYALSIARLDRTSRFIHSMPYYGFYASLDGQPIVHDHYALPEHYRNEVFDPGLRLTPLGQQRTAVGAVLELRTDTQIYDLKITRPQLLLKLTTAPYHPLEWLFSRDTLAAWQANDSDLRATQLRVGAYLLGRLADSTSIEPLRSVTTHPNHSVRWAAVQALGRLSRSEGVAQLEQAASDPHPHVRRAAQRALAAVGKAGAV